MVERLADRLNTVQRRLFVGREDEQALFRTALAASEPPFIVLHIFGPGGVGKSSLLREFKSVCADTHMEAIAVDARDFEPSPESFHAALGQALSTLGVTPANSHEHFIADPSHRHVILIDTYELLESLDDWLREDFLPQLPVNTLVVMAGRNALQPAWRFHTGWQNLVHSISLSNLDAQESRAYLTKRQVPSEQHTAVLNFTHGHPLALSLVADLFAQRSPTQHTQNALFNFEPEAAPDVVQTLLAHLVQKVPSPAHRAALEVCALVRLTTEALLTAMLTIPDSIAHAGAGSLNTQRILAVPDTHEEETSIHELFEWLRGLSFIESGRFGLFPHDLTREAIVADLRWRNPDWYGELHRRAHTYYASRLQAMSDEAPLEEQGRILLDYIFLNCNTPVVRSFLEWQDTGGLTSRPGRETDWPELVAMVAQHEGQESARLAAHWFERQPQGVQVVQDATGHAVGFVARIALHQTAPGDAQVDPGALAAWRHLRGNAPLQSGEEATLFRFWMAHDTYQDISPVQSLIFVNVVRHMLSTPQLAFTFLACADPDFWEPVLTYAETMRLPAADFQVGERCYGMYQRDWRALPMPDWLATLSRREAEVLAAEDFVTPDAVAKDTVEERVASQVTTASAITSQTTTLNHAEFATAVQDALRNLTRPTTLRDNPLLRSRLITERAGSDAATTERVTALQTLLTEVCETFRSSPRDEKFYHALYHAYLHPAPTREAAADLMGVPFGTFRRYMKSGVTQVIEILWQRERGD